MSEQEIWDGIEQDYLSGMSVADIAEKWGKPASTIYKKATSKGWKSKLEKIRQKADEIVLARRARVRAKELEEMESAGVGMARLLHKTVEALEAKPPDEVIRSLKGMGALAAAIKANTEALMTIYGIQTPAQEAGQKIARKRLALDERRQRFEEGKQADETRDREVKLTISVRGKDDGAGSTDSKAEE